MEYNLNNNHDSVSIREQSSSVTIWYWVLAIVILGLLGWYGYTAGWFSQRMGSNEILKSETNNGINMDTTMDNAAPIDSIRIETQESFPVGKTLIVSGTLPNGCTYLEQPTQIRDGNIFYVNLVTRTEGDICTEALVPYEERIALQVNNLPAGVYLVNINGREISFELESDNKLNFNAGSDK